MHVRPPSIDHGIVSFLWGLVLGVLVWAFMLSVGLSKPTAAIIGVLAGCAIFLYVRICGEEEPRRQTGRPRGRSR